MENKLDQQIDTLIDKARVAMDLFRGEDQDNVDMAVRALAWAIYKPENSRLLAEMAVKDTGLGNVESKVTKNTRKTFGTLRDLLRAKTIGEIENKPELGLIKYGKPVGVVGAICPSTNPSATPANKAMMAVKGGNAVIIAPSPAGYVTTAKTVEFMRAELENSGFPPDLVQVLPSPVNKEATQKLIEKVDLAVVTGSQNNVSRAMRSGTVSIGVGPGNVPVIIDQSADLDDAAKKITLSKIFDNATSCSSENALVILNNVYEQAVQSLTKEGGWLCTPEQRMKVQEKLWVNGVLNRSVIAKDAHIAADVFGLPPEARNSKFFMVEEKVIGGKGSFADEKLSLVLTLYRAK
ncbi:MAG: aldehyde dehydrogenase family protein, partial [Rhodobacteraceae bacterium]|nr:aldehyde dehydrogenase family protein [Paracoccaceae bacterium]